jgi:hypothetical protein
VTARGLAADAFKCALCGARFTHGPQACAACPLRPSCHVVQCPRCGYQFPRPSGLAAWLCRLLGAAEEP